LNEVEHQHAGRDAAIVVVEMIVPVPADPEHGEADQIAAKGGRVVRERMRKLADGAPIDELGNSQLEHEDGHRNREDTVEQKLQPALADGCHRRLLCHATPDWN
jgi:hypothetical protein